MAQFDPFIIFNVIIYLLIVLSIYYSFVLENLIPFFFGASKVRRKKLNYINAS